MLSRKGPLNENAIEDLTGLHSDRRRALQWGLRWDLKRGVLGLRGERGDMSKRGRLMPRTDCREQQFCGMHRDSL